MPDKEKSKVHPFAGILRTDEEVLWMAIHNTSFWARISGFGRFYGLFVIGVVFNAFINFSGTPADRLQTAAFTIVLLTVLFALVLFLAALFIRFKQTRTPEFAYAVTSERLLYHHNKEMKSLDLDQASVTSVPAASGSIDTLNFGETFPSWNNIKDGVYVQRTIEKAQKRLLEKIEHA